MTKSKSTSRRSTRPKHRSKSRSKSRSRITKKGKKRSQPRKSYSKRHRRFGFKYLRNDQIIDKVLHDYPSNLTCDRA